MTVGAAIAVASAGSGGVGGINVGPGRHGLKEACMQPCWTWSGSRCAAGRYGECFIEAAMTIAKIDSSRTIRFHSTLSLIPATMDHGHDGHGNHGGHDGMDMGPTCSMQMLW